MADAATLAAVAAATLAFNTELWTLYAFGVLITSLRTYARIKAVGFRDLRIDDYIVWVAIALYTTQVSLAYSAVNHGQGLANNGMTDAARAELSVDSVEYALRVFGSKIQVVGWTFYTCLIFTLKMAMLFFYIRLMEGLDRNFQMRIWIGFGLVIATWIASVITIYGACRPLSRYWQINPDPGNMCQGAIAKPIVWVTFGSSVVTDIYLIMIPLPMLWGTKLKLPKKIGASIVLGAGIFVLVCSLLKTVFVEIDPVNGAQLAGQWGVREVFVSVITTSLPMIFPLVKNWLRPLFGSGVFSSDMKTSQKYPTGFRTIGGTEETTRTGNNRTTTGNNHRRVSSSNLYFTESEEHIVQTKNDLKMQGMNVSVGRVTDPQREIVMTNEFIMTNDRISKNVNVLANPKPHEEW